MKWTKAGEGDLPKGTFWREFRHEDGTTIKLEARAANAEFLSGGCEPGFMPGVKVQATRPQGGGGDVRFVCYIPTDLVGDAGEIMRKAAELLRTSALPPRKFANLQMVQRLTDAPQMVGSVGQATHTGDEWIYEVYWDRGAGSETYEREADLKLAE